MGNNKPLLIIRASFGTLALLSIFFYAIRNMPLKYININSIYISNFISIFAAIFINEKVTKNIIFGLIFWMDRNFILLNPNQITNLNVEISNLNQFNSIFRSNIYCISLRNG